MTLGVNPRRAGAAHAVGDRLRQLDDLDRARAVGQAADEAALFERGDQAVDAGLGSQVEGILHLVERGRHAGFLEPFVDEAQKLCLLAGQHLSRVPRLRAAILGLSKQIMNKHYPFHMCSATI